MYLYMGLVALSLNQRMRVTPCSLVTSHGRTPVIPCRPDTHTMGTETQNKLGKVCVSWDLGIGIFCISSILSHLYSFRSCFHIIYRKNWPNFPLWLYDSLISSYILQNRKPNMTTRNSLLSSLASLREEMISVFFVFCPLGLNSQCSKV